MNGTDSIEYGKGTEKGTSVILDKTRSYRLENHIKSYRYPQKSGAYVFGKWSTMSVRVGGDLPLSLSRALSLHNACHRIVCFVMHDHYVYKFMHTRGQSS